MAFSDFHLVNPPWPVSKMTVFNKWLVKFLKLHSGLSRAAEGKLVREVTLNPVLSPSQEIIQATEQS